MTNGPWIDYGYEPPYVYASIADSGGAAVTSVSTTTFADWPVGTASLTAGMSDQAKTPRTDAQAWSSGSGATSAPWFSATDSYVNWEKNDLPAGSEETFLAFNAAASQYLALGVVVPGGAGVTYNYETAEGTGTAVAVPSGTPRYGDELVFLAVGVRGSQPTVTWPEGWAQVGVVNGTSGTFALAYCALAQSRDSLGSVTASATLSASGAWYASTLTFQLLRPTPVVPEIEAGSVVTAAQLNQIAYAADFLANLPCTVATGSTTPVAAGGGRAGVAFTQVLVDTDGMAPTVSGGSTSSDLTEYIIQRKGFYDVSLVAETAAVAATDDINVGIFASAGPNNPGQAQGSQMFSLYGAWTRTQYAPGAVNLSPECGGVLPGVLYPGDHMGVFLFSNKAAMTLETATVRFTWIGDE